MKNLSSAFFSALNFTGEVLLLLIPVIAILAVLYFFQKNANGYLLKAFNKGTVIFAGIIGTPVHEAGHILMCLIFGHKVKSFKLIDFKAPGGTLGYVNHSFNSKNYYQRAGNFFIGLAPILSAALVVWLLSLYIPFFTGIFSHAEVKIGNNLYSAAAWKDFFVLLFSHTINSVETIGQLLVNNFRPEYILYIFILYSISLHFSPSPSDFKNSWYGFITIGIIFLLAVFLLELTGVKSFNYKSLTISAIIKVINFLAGMLFPSLLALILSYLISLPVYLIREKKILSPAG